MLITITMCVLPSLNRLSIASSVVLSYTWPRVVKGGRTGVTLE